MLTLTPAMADMEVSADIIYEKSQPVYEYLCQDTEIRTVGMAMAEAGAAPAMEVALLVS